MAVLGGVGLGVVVGWLLPIMVPVTWRSVVASAGAVAMAAATIFLLVGLSASLGGLFGVAAGAWLHATFIEHLAARTANRREA